MGNYQSSRSSYNPSKVTTRKTDIHKKVILGSSLVLPIFCFLLLMDNSESHTRNLNSSNKTDVESQHITLKLPLPEMSTSDGIVVSKSNFTSVDHNRKSAIVKKGDTLTHIFKRVGLNKSQLNKVIGLGKKIKPFTRLIPQQQFEFTMNEQNELIQMVYHANKTRKHVLQKKNNNYIIYKESKNLEPRVTYAKGTINSSLFESAKNSGLSTELTMELAHLFGWDIDFALDIRQGDSFVVMYEELFLDGEKIKDGNILAAEFTNQGKRFKAIRYTNEKGNSSYYSENGENMRKAFLRTPVDFTRISSRFGSRYHPILKKRKSHKGVDYAAPRGTPVKAAGDGKIIWRARKGGYGKAVIIQHGNRYSTLYGHLKSYNRKAKRNRMIKQGQIIGYVGSTGRATGPHLHYEFRVNGVHRNPLTIKLPSASPIDKKYLSDFLAKSRPLISQLELIKNVNVAMSNL